MNILQINAVCDSGSTGRTCRELSDWLIDHGHKSLVVYGSGKSNYEYAVNICSRFDKQIHGLLERLTGYNARFSYRATRKLFKIIENFAPDVIHLRNLHGNYVHVPKLLQYLGEHDIPTVITLHDCWPFTGKCMHYTSTKCNRWKESCGKCPRLHQDIPSWWFDRTHEMLEEKQKLFSEIPRLAVIGVSDWVTNEARQSILKNAKILTRIYNWIDTEVFYPRENARKTLGISNDEFIVLFISASWQIGSRKYQDLFQIAKRLSEEKIVMLLAGNIQNDADVLKIPTVKKLGYIDTKEKLADIYSSANVYVHLSREDTFGKVIAESMSCGTPVIVYDQTACPELVHEDCGFIVSGEDIDKIIQCIKNIQTQTKIKYLYNCCEFVRNNFNKENLIRDNLQIYSKIIKNEYINI